MGASVTQILLKNPLIRGIKKFLLKDQTIKDLVIQKNVLMDIVNQIKPLQNLCQPSKIRIRNMMKMYQIQEDVCIPLTDKFYGDLIYIEKGCLEICFENVHYDQIDKATLNRMSKAEKQPVPEGEQDVGDQLNAHGFDNNKSVKKNTRILRFCAGDYFDFTWKSQQPDLKDMTIKYIKCIQHHPHYAPLRERFPVDVPTKKTQRLTATSKLEQQHAEAHNTVPVTKKELKQSKPEARTEDKPEIKSEEKVIEPIPEKNI